MFSPACHFLLARKYLSSRVIFLKGGSSIGDRDTCALHALTPETPDGSENRPRPLTVACIHFSYCSVIYIEQIRYYHRLEPHFSIPRAQIYGLAEMYPLYFLQVFTEFYCIKKSLASRKP